MKKGKFFSISVNILYTETVKRDLLYFFKEFDWVQGIFIFIIERRFINFLFSFVRFNYEEDTLKAVRKVNNKKFKGIRIFFKIVRFVNEGYYMFQIDEPRKRRYFPSRFDYSFISSRRSKVINSEGRSGMNLGTDIKEIRFYKGGLFYICYIFVLQ